MQLIGLATIGRDAELRYTNNGKAVCEVSLAYDVGYGDKKTTQWVSATLWDKQAESLAPYLKKSVQVGAFLDDVKIEEYQKKDGSTGTKLVGRVAKIELCRRQNTEHDAPKPQPKQAAGFDDSDDSIPF